MRRTLILLVVLLLVVPHPTLAQEDPNFEVYVPEETLTPGETTEFTVDIVNFPRDLIDYVDPARNVKVRFRSGSTPFEVRSGTQILGRIEDREYKSATARIFVPANTPAGTYRIPVDITHEFDIKDKETQTVYAEVRVEPRARFQVESTEGSVPVDGTGTVSVRVTNVGEEPALESALALESRTPDISFGESSTASRFVGHWAPNETKTIEVEARAGPDAETRNYTLYGTVEYESVDGENTQSRQLQLGVTPIPEQTFTLENVEGTLRAGEEGTLRGEVVNTGTRTASNAVVQFAPPSGTITATESEYAVGTLEPDERASFEFTVEAGTDAGAGPRQFSFTVDYRDIDDERRTSDSLDALVDVGERRDEFSLEALDTQIEAGSDGRLRVEVTNTLDEPLSDISAKLYVEEPLSSSDDEAFVGQLEPGATAEVVFQLGASGSALEKTYPVQVDFRYDDADGDTRISDTYQLPMQVQLPEDDGSLPVPLPVIVALVALIVVAVAVVVYRRRNGGSDSSER
jgi:hypothetical protein